MPFYLCIVYGCFCATIAEPRGHNRDWGTVCKSKNIYCLLISRKCALTLCICDVSGTQCSVLPSLTQGVTESFYPYWENFRICSQTCLRYFSQTGLCQFANHGWTHGIKWHSERQPDKNVFTHRRWRRFAFGLEWDVGRIGVWGWHYYLWGKVMRWGERVGREEFQILATLHISCATLSSNW